MTTLTVLDSAGLPVAIEKPLVPGRSAAATSRPVVLSTEDKAAVDALATQATAAAILAKLIADPATQTTLAAILAKIIAAPATEAKQDAAITQETAINTVLGTTAGAAVTTSIAGTIQGYLRGIVSLLVSGITVAAHAVTQSGTWTVQPGNTANTTAWKVDGSAVTQPASIAAGAAAIAKAEDVASADADVGVPAMAVRKATPANTSGTDGDYEMLQMFAGRLWVSAVLEATAVAIGKLAANSGVVIGAVENNTVATSGGLASTSRLLSAAATTNATSVKGSAGRLYKMQGYNAATAVRYLKLYNKASAPTVGSDTPVRTIALPPGAAFDLDWSNLGYYFSTGIAYALTTGSADADTGALAAGDILGLNMDYA